MTSPEAGQIKQIEEADALCETQRGPVISTLEIQQIQAIQSALPIDVYLNL